MNWRKSWQFFLIMLTLSVQSFSLQAQEVKATIDHKAIKIGEQSRITLELSFPVATKNVMMPELRDTITKFVEVVGVSDIDTAFDESDVGIKIYTQIITITSWDSGFHVIPPFKFKLDQDSIQTQALLLEVISVDVLPEKDIKDIKSIKEVPFSIWDWILAHLMEILLTWFLAILIIIGIYLYIRYKNRPDPEEKLVPKEAADILAKRKLKELEEKKLWQSNKVKAYYSSLSYIIREYIENRFEFNALELTTDEILGILEMKMDEDKKMRDRIYQLLFNADMAKYAKQQPMASENDEAMLYAKDFVEKTAFREELNESEVIQTEEKKTDV